MARKSTDVKNKEDKEEALDLKGFEKELDKFIDEKKETLVEEALSKIDEQIEFKVNKRMKEEEKRLTHSQKVRIIRQEIIIILLLAVIGYMGYCLYDVDYFNIRKDEVPSIKEDKKDVQDNSPKQDDNQEQEPDSKPKQDSKALIEKYGTLVDKLQIDDESIFDLYNKSYTRDTLSNELKLKIAYKNLDKKNITEEQEMLTFTSKDLLESAKKIFGNDTTLKDTSFNYNNNKFMFYNDMYLGLKNDQVAETKFLYEIVEAREDEDILSFEVLIAKIENGELLDLKDNTVLKEYKNEKLKDFKDKLQSYKITFEKDEEEYIFLKIENINSEKEA